MYGERRICHVLVGDNGGGAGRGIDLLKQSRSSLSSPGASRSYFKITLWQHRVRWADRLAVGDVCHFGHGRCNSPSPTPATSFVNLLLPCTFSHLNSQHYLGSRGAHSLSLSLSILAQHRLSLSLSLISQEPISLPICCCLPLSPSLSVSLQVLSFLLSPLFKRKMQHTHK